MYLSCNIQNGARKTGLPCRRPTPTLVYETAGRFFVRHSVYVYIKENIHIGSLCVGYLVDKVVLGQFFLREFLLSVFSRMFQTNQHINTSRTRKASGRSLGPSRTKALCFDNGEQWTEQYCHVVSLRGLAPSVLTSAVHVSLPICM